MTVIHVVVGLIFNSHQEILVAEREAQKFQGGRWEFPGGKVELNENPFDALKRELGEEIGIEIISAEPWQSFQHEYADRKILLDVWKIKAFKGEAVGKEGQAICWVSLKNLCLLSIPDANQKIIEKLMNESHSTQI